LVDEVMNKKQINPIGYFWKPWFYKYVELFLSKTEGKEGKEIATMVPPTTEYIPLTHYFHRHTRPLFWEMKEIIPFGNALWFRCLFGWLGPPHVKLLKKTQTETIRRLYEKHHVIQDMLIPLGALGDAINTFHDEIEIYPLWLCPMQLFASGDSGFMKPVVQDGQVVERMFVDVGAYGVPMVPSFEASSTVRRLESFVRKVKGYQALYADCFMTREEFREMFDHSAYDSLRARYGAVDAFPEIYDKISRAARR
jgi:delta24-sterol reductase